MTRKITMAADRIAAGLQKRLHTGDLYACRGWGIGQGARGGDAAMLQADEPDDFVIATGTSYTGRDFMQIALGHGDLDWEKHVEFDARYLRPTEVDNPMGDASKTETALGWKANSPTPDLAPFMVDVDRANLEPKNTQSHSRRRTFRRPASMLEHLLAIGGPVQSYEDGDVFGARGDPL